MVSNPYLDLWRSSGLDAARDLAIGNGENVVYYNPHTNRLDVANPDTQTASVYDDAMSGASSVSPVFLIVGGLLLAGLLK